MKKQHVVISLGGSLIAPESIDEDFLINLRATLKRFSHTHQFVLICGGGATARKYQAVARQFKATPELLDWIGIQATIINAWLVRSVFGNEASSNIITNPLKIQKNNSPITVAAGWKPGWSTDYDAVIIAHKLRSNTVVNLSNTNAVYTVDPRTAKNAKPIPCISWKQYIAMIPQKWSPGMNCPFDPIAARLAAKHKIRVAIMNGKPLTRLVRFLKTGCVQGTLIHS
ncbi:MAG: UMP kinase [Candidatus Woesearchaeota archaeon]|nr:UMP kinase [Candidatus Woesearchaeota archaeon]